MYAASLGPWQVGDEILTGIDEPVQLDTVLSLV